MDVGNSQLDPSHGMSSSSKNAQVEVIVVPFPCHSHLNQLLQLSCLISSSSYNIPVHYATTATHLRQVKLRFHSQTHLQNPNIHFHEFPTPPFLSPPPNPNSSSKFPSHLQPSFDASIQLRDPVADLLREISNTATRVVVIHDFLMAYVVQDIAIIPNAESYIFSPVSAFNMSFRLLKDNKSFQSLDELKGLSTIQGRQCQGNYPSSSMDVGNIQLDPSHGMSSSSKNSQVEVIVVPFPCHSHLNQLLQLSCLISSSSYNIPVHYATTATHLRQVKLRFNSQTHLQNPNIYFHEFPTPPFLSPPPNPNSSFKFPSHLQPSFDASIQLRDPVAGLLREISNTATRVVVIHDSLMAYVVQDIATIPNAESYIFSPVSAFNMYLPRFAGKGNEQ
ncbi:hypothetical protein RHGRI_010535 [Rhododendron griersonianum]|uniref:Glycosyltransferase N-terminal domain-containing protein n=1 Tax=Rhododendron griersonianum TaxID=479676 RepID=A0AAV6KIZ0_9ERIC|nr:hypothetical protein RHGRI_010535 [Rhododendron griersonianum]